MNLEVLAILIIVVAVDGQVVFLRVVLVGHNYDALRLHASKPAVRTTVFDHREHLVNPSDALRVEMWHIFGIMGNQGIIRLDLHLLAVLVNNVAVGLDNCALGVLNHDAMLVGAVP